MIISSNRTILELKLIWKSFHKHDRISFQSYHTGIEIKHILYGKQKEWNFQSYHTGIEMLTKE